MSLPTAVPPHPELGEYYAGEPDHRRFLSQIFDETAGQYDRINAFLSLGTGKWYRFDALRRAGLNPGMNVLDVAVGTGLVAREGKRRLKGQGILAGLDPSRGMLRQARAAVGDTLIQGRAERIPFKDGAFDFLSMGYALRHVTDLHATFQEYLRVLRPGGTLLILDFQPPQGRVGRAAGFFLRRAVPALARHFCGGPSAERLMRYCWDTVEYSVGPDVTETALAEVGFERLRRTTWAGVFVEYAASSPGGPTP